MPQPLPLHDLIGVGLGPANLALALALRESKVDFRFFESKPCFGWHRGMLLENATMQIPFLKDLGVSSDTARIPRLFGMVRAAGCGSCVL